MNNDIRRIGILVAEVLVLGWAMMPLAALAQSRGDVVSLEWIDTRSGAEVSGELRDLLDNYLDDPSGFFDRVIDIILPSRYRVAAYRIVYHTIDARGRPTIASGLVTVPLGFNHPAAMAVYHHGTFADDASAPSNLGPESMVGYALGAEGYVAVLPDYIGFGASPGIHPYIHANSEASAAIDMMRAVRQVLAAVNFPLNGQIFLTGYSQGGHACVATLREIERSFPDEFKVTLTSAGSGPYDVGGVQYRYIVENPRYPSQSYLPLLLLGYREVYGEKVVRFDDMLVPPYNKLIPALFDRTNTLGQIERQLPDTWTDMFVPEFLDAVATNPFHPVRLALRENGLLNFTPQSPLLMFYGTEDEQVAYQNSILAWFYYRILRQAPAPVCAIPLGPLSHGECIPMMMILTKLNFDALRTF